ncbi:NADH-quinone oxidoreductase [Komagataeibacter intermedius]|uniref:NADH-quinone oxidoreductase n=2 Tax=Komagataeibacter intermedius TaxID=66229 RepID=A0A0N1FDX6_9PROT|nr:NADH-quinone oxidoreductase [Komagataeibacter intermedius]KPH89009.1 NADH-quinone oxidoreductase [Komagataeibacter intermedius AF2]MCF3635076.1 NADH-quinone oxidoreductase [Komagataeibacter intermedius]GAN87597.1 NADH-ubiquinone oxidoreductase 49kDa subunit [Komagataeibacter intermedius TF2]GBQ66141.1 NADH-ubiquinone oxidoreductase 49kDa subunit [Komagataeibacter intermedius NRIC 0521]
MTAQVPDLIRSGMPAACAGRFVLDGGAWRDMVENLRHSTLPLLGLWSDGVQIHALFMEGTCPLLASVAVMDGRYLALSPVRAGAAAYERITQDLWGIEGMGATDSAPWLDQGRWPVTWPLHDRPPPAPAPPEGVEFTDDAAMVQAGGTVVGYGPAEGDFHSPFHLRLGLPGERIMQVRTRMGYAHRGLCARMRGATVAQAARLVARIDATATVAHQVAFARALGAAGEQAGADMDDAAMFVGELERIAIHLDTLATAADLLADGRFAILAATLLERVRQACRDGCGSRLLFDVLPPAGDTGRAVSIPMEILTELRTGCATLRRLFWRPRGMAMQARGRGILSADAARRWGIAGCVGRASGAEGDLRAYVSRSAGHEGMGGDVADRLAMRLQEVETAVGILSTFDGAAVSVPAGHGAHGSGEGVGCVEGPTGPVWHWVRVEHGRVAAWWCGDASLLLFQALPGILSGAVYEDVPLILTSLGLSAAGADL